jgi:hypothetical protein
MLSHETNARRLVAVLLQHFPIGGTSEDLRKQFEIATGLVNQSFYNALKHAKQQKWLIGGGRGQPYCLSPDGSWKEPDIASIGESIGVSRDKSELEYLVGTQTRQIGELQDKVERLLDWKGGDDVNGVALPSLVRIVGDGSASTRQRIKAAAAVLAYKTQDTAVIEFVKRFLGSVCASADIGNVDYKIEAGELLRKHEAPRIASESVRPSYSEGDTAANRTEAWRVYERWQLRKQIVLETREPPQPGWDTHLQPDTYAGPPEGNCMPPVRVVTDPVSGFRLLDSLLPKKPYRIGDGGDDDSTQVE